jgi:TRAP-type mannitol/chloroaromatic compound transport system substrate-binding protein
MIYISSNCNGLEMKLKGFSDEVGRRNLGVAANTVAWGFELYASIEFPILIWFLGAATL